MCTLFHRDSFAFFNQFGTFAEIFHPCPRLKMSKRKAEVVTEEDNYLDDLVQDKQSNRPSTSKHTLDSDEEDSGDDDGQ